MTHGKFQSALFAVVGSDEEELHEAIVTILFQSALFAVVGSDPTPENVPLTRTFATCLHTWVAQRRECGRGGVRRTMFGLVSGHTHVRRSE